MFNLNTKDVYILQKFKHWFSQNNIFTHVSICQNSDIVDGQQSWLTMFIDFVLNSKNVRNTSAFLVKNCKFETLKLLEFHSLQQTSVFKNCTFMVNSEECF